MRSAAPSLARSVLLSFCIPTFNRGAFIGEALESIVKQAKNDIEIVIVDGGSTDNTSEVVEYYRNQFSNIYYHRQSYNAGVDRDMDASVRLAKGEYCWLMSSDDIIAPGAIDRIRRALESGADIYLSNITLCTKELNAFSDSRFLAGRRIDRCFDLSNRKNLLAYFQLATSNNALFCYMACIGFRTDKWRAIPFNEDFADSGYAHVFSLFSMTRDYPCVLKYIADPLILNRGDNDSFLKVGITNRYRMDFDGYRKLGYKLWPVDAELRQAFLSVTSREHRWYRLIKLRANTSRKEWYVLAKSLPEFGYGNTLLMAIGFFGWLPFINSFAVPFWRVVKRWRSFRWNGKFRGTSSL